MQGRGILSGLVLVGVSALTSMLSFGTYGYLREKKKYSSWKAGATTGLITGGIGLATAFVVSRFAPTQVAPAAGIGQLPYMTPASYMKPVGPNVRLRERYPAAYKGLGMLVAERLSGCSSCV
ncbi:MAG: hypothetical protein ACYTBJ_00165 [Planctomycetota bacterium]|jgi:hypothetical protein